MKLLLNSIALVALMTVPTLAQDQGDYDAFGIEDDGATLDQLAPDDGSLPPPIPPLDDAAEAFGDAVPSAPDAPDMATADSPAVAPAATAEIAGFEAPAEWQEKSVSGFSFRFPADWAVMEDDRDQVMIFNGDMQTQQGAMFGIVLDRFDSQDDVLPPGAEILSDTPVTVAGQPFRRMEVKANIDATHMAEMILLLSDQPVDDNKGILISGVTVGEPLDKHRGIFEQMFGTLRFTAPAPELETALDGLVVYTVQDGWQDIGRSDGMVTYPPEYNGAIRVIRGDSVDGRKGVVADIPPGTQGRAVQALGKTATLYTYPGTEPEYYQGGAPVPGQVMLYLLDDCAPNGDRIALVVAGVAEAITSDSFRAAVAGIALSEEAILATCVPRASVAPMTEGAMANDSAAARPVADDLAPSPDTSGATETPEGAAALTATLPVQIEVGGVTYLLPDGWQASYESPDAKYLNSPDGRFTVLSFWWFPDEPLLGYDDIESVENVIVDHEPVTRIVSDHGEWRSIQNVTERARSTAERFIFTLEGAGVAPEELRALHDQLVATLRFGAGFDPSKPVEFASAPAPAPVIATPAPAAAAESPNSGPAFTVNFADGLQGWAGSFATLSILPGSGPDGRDVLEAFTPGEGTNGYLIAPPERLSEWTGTKGLAVTIRSHGGTYVEPYDYGGRGDIYISSRGKSASIAFPRRVTQDWQTMTVDFNDPGWKLDGGATSMAEVLNFVTALNIRVEFIEGDARSWVSSVSLLPGGGGADQPLAAPAATGWTRFVNARFGTAIDYDASLFLPQPAPENGDGLTFISTDGLGRFVVFGQNNYDSLDAHAMMTRDRDMAGYDEVTYQTAGNGWYVLSGYSGGDIFYRKAVIDRSGDLVHVFEISYPPAQRAAYDPIVTRMAKSLTGG